MAKRIDMTLARLKALPIILDAARRYAAGETASATLAVKAKQALKVFE